MRDIFSMIAVIGGTRQAPRQPKVHTMPDMVGLSGETVTGLDLKKMVPVNVTDQVRQELTEMKAIGIRVSEDAFECLDDVEEYRANGMKISEIADLVRDLGGIGL